MKLGEVSRRLIAAFVSRAFANFEVIAAEKTAVATAAIFITLRFKVATVVVEGITYHWFYLNMNIILKFFQYYFSTN
jgi:hypothetical protein